MKVLNPEAAARIEELEKEIAKIKHDSLSCCQKRDVYIVDLTHVHSQFIDENKPLCALVEYAPDTHKFLIESGIEKGLDKVLAVLFEELRETLR